MQCLCSISEAGKREGNSSSSSLLFYSGPQWISDAQPLGGGQLLSPLIQMLILPGNNLRDTPRNNVDLSTPGPTPA